MKNLVNKIEQKSDTETSDKMNEFLDKVDHLCFEYGYEIWASKEGWKGYDFTPPFFIHGDDEVKEILFIDGDGRGK